jgi:hypothetical protein
MSDMERLSVFYANLGYDFYGTPSGALCVYKNGDAWPVGTGLESQRIIRLAVFTVILCKTPGVSLASASTPCSTT